MPSILSAHGYFEFPAPETWPTDALRAFGKATGERSLIDVFIFEHGFTDAMYMEDAVTALAVLPIPHAEWSTRLGYPVVMFDPSKVDQYSQKLVDAGYRVAVMEKCAQREPEENGKVINIASARATVSQRRHKWA